MTLSTFLNNNIIEAGVDEAGRGPALGRVYAAAVIWPPGLDTTLVKDSKLIKKDADMKISYDFVINNAIDYAVAYATEGEIDKCGVGHANMRAMHRAIDKLKIKPQWLLVDGNYFELYSRKGTDTINHTTVVGGDHKYYSIAAASILAKYSRDKYIYDLCDEYPELDTRYDIRSNKGYISAPKHKDGIAEHGLCQFHRLSWKCCKGEIRVIKPSI